jgi:hypothetical protein
MIRYLETRPPVFFVILFLVYALSAAFAVCARYDFNATALIRFGHRYVAQNPDLTPENAVRFLGNEASGGNGYDGQIFYYYARTVWMKDRWPLGFSNAYRAPRVGYPLIASILPLPGNTGQAWAMILSQLLLISGGVWCFAGLLPKGGKALAALYAVSPFQLQSFLFLVSDSVMISLVVIGLYLARRPGVFFALGTWLAFALAVLTKESSLFLLFPVGLFALWRRDWKMVFVALFALVPQVLWQVYLFKVHGMLPASILSIFLSPLSGIIGVLRYSLELLQQTPFPAGEFVKQSPKWLLILLIAAALWFSLSRFSRDWRSSRDPDSPLPYYAGSMFVLLSVMIADYSYFWGIFENIGRMFTPLVGFLLLGGASADRSRSFRAACVVLILLSGLVWLRAVAMTPSFPFDLYLPYSGPEYPKPPVP